MASDWLAAVLPANQMPGLKILIENLRFKHGHVLVTQAPGPTLARQGPLLLTEINLNWDM